MIELLLSHCTEIDSGARNIDNILNSFVLPALAKQILLGLAEQKMPQHIFIDVQDNEILYQVNPVVKSIKKTEKKAPYH